MSRMSASFGRFPGLTGKVFLGHQEAFGANLAYGTARARRR